MDHLKASLMNHDVDDVVKVSIVLALNEFIEKERDEHLRTAAYERSSKRHDYRNGYYEWNLLMSIGKITLRLPGYPQWGLLNIGFRTLCAL